MRICNLQYVTRLVRVIYFNTCTGICAIYTKGEHKQSDTLKCNPEKRTKDRCVFSLRIKQMKTDVIFKAQTPKMAHTLFKGKIKTTKRVNGSTILFSFL